MSTTLATNTPAREGLALASTWRSYTAEERKRRAVTAANTRDAAELASLTIAYLSLHGRASTSTRRGYTHAIRRLTAAWADEGVNMLRPTPEDGHLYVRRLEARHAVATVRVHLAGCAALYRALRWAKATEAYPFEDVKIKKRDGRRPDEKRPAFEEDDVRKLLAKAAPVDAVLVLLGARGGLRLAEALALRWQDVHEGEYPTLHVANGKGDQPRDVEVVPELADALAALRAQGDGRGYVLPYRSQTRARQRLRRLQERAKVTIKPGRAAHSLRHTAGTVLYETTGDLVAVQEWLGHASVSTSRGYVHRAERKKLRDLARELPRLMPAPA